VSAIGFPSDDALLAAMAAGVVPRDAVVSPARHGRTPDGGPWVEPAGPLDAATRAGLLALGAVEFTASEEGPSLRASCWPEVLPTVRVPEPDEIGEVLFEVPVGELLVLAGELLRLGCDRQQWAIFGERALLLSRSPPWFTVLRASDGTGRIRAYVRGAPEIWVEVGWSHPLLRALRVAPGSLWLVRGGAPWQVVADGPWTSIYDQVDLELPGTVQPSTGVEPPRLSVRLRLVDRGRVTPPSLWVIRRQAVRAVEGLLSSVPDEVAERLSFAVTSGADPVVVLRARPSPKGPPAIELQESYTPWLELPNLYLPDDASLEPPLRRDRLREVLAPEPFEVSWLVRDGAGFRVERIAEQAFRPLAAWVDYLAERDVTALTGWVAAAEFSFDDWVDLGLEWSDAPPAPERPAPRRRARSSAYEEVDAPAPETGPAPVAAASRVRPRPAPVVVETGADAEQTAARLAAIEHSFLELDAPTDAPERVPLWMEMATLCRRLGRDREASLCWVHAIWSAPEARQDELGARWATEELDALGMDADGVRASAATAPSVRVLQALAACLTSGALQPDGALSASFVAHDNELDVRTSWLGRAALARGDSLTLARAKDAVLARLRGGLTLERDVPTFLRELDADAVRLLAAHLTAQLEHFRRTRRERSIVEANPALTQAYVNLVFAWGFATLGERERARELAADLGPVNLTDPVHGALVSAYQARIQSALQGVAREAPLPPAVAGRFEALGGAERFKVDRLRLFSAVLEAQDRLDPFAAFTLGHDPRGAEFTPLRSLDDPAALAERLRALLPLAHGESTARIAAGVLDFLPLLAVGDAVPLLERVLALVPAIEARERVKVLEGALLVAGQLGRTDRVRDLSGLLDLALRELPRDQLAGQAESLVNGLRALRRVGLHDTAGALLEGVIQRAGASDPDGVVIRAAAAGGLFGLGRLSEATHHVDAALSALDADIKVMQARLRLTRVIGLALSAAPRSVALERLPRLSAHLGQITDMFSTNSHFCLSVISYAESVVLGYTDHQLALSKTARRWMDDAEFLVRRRIHAA
jgi:hypothetical protein